MLPRKSELSHTDYAADARRMNPIRLGGIGRTDRAISYGDRTKQSTFTRSTHA
jgi:hypothetical protein